MDAQYLRPEVVVEPLVHHWYAIPHLLPPQSASLKFAFKFLPVLRSFVASPALHAQALKSPAMSGGSFVDIDPSRVDEVRALIADAESRLGGLIALAQAIRGLDALLQSEVSGESLEPVYARVPPVLQGYVELLYDLRHRPWPRFLEGLLYKSPHYDEGLQNLSFSIPVREQRAFAQTTPRLAGPDRLVFPARFRDPALDRLFAMRWQPGSVEAMGETFGLRGASLEQFRTFFTSTPPAPRPRFDGPGVRVRYCGHSCVLFETREGAVLTDPTLPSAHPQGPERFTFTDLPEHIDAVVISHAHPDHVWLESLLQLRGRIGKVFVPKSSGNLVDTSLALLLKALGFRAVQELDECDEVALPGGSLTSLPALGEHADLPIRTKHAMAFRFGGTSFLLTGDANLLEPKLLEHLRAIYGAVDVLFVGMEATGAPMSWGYGEFFSSPPARKIDQSRRLNSVDFDRARRMVEQFEPKEVYVYAMGREPWTAHLMGADLDERLPHMVGSARLVEHCRAQGRIADRPYGRMERVYGA